ncbi:MAG: hypothetical protein J7D61_15565 [Marichromatium sp.]|nr:hypothetical protein [Marichromatium sp.]
MSFQFDFFSVFLGGLIGFVFSVVLQEYRLFRQQQRDLFNAVEFLKVIAKVLELVIHLDPKDVPGLSPGHIISYSLPILKAKRSAGVLQDLVRISIKWKSGLYCRGEPAGENAMNVDIKKLGAICDELEMKFPANSEKYNFIFFLKGFFNV